MVDLNSPIIIAVISAIVGAIVGVVVTYFLGRRGSEKHIKTLIEQTEILQKQNESFQDQTKTLQEQTKALKEQNDSLKKIAENQEKRIEFLGVELDKITQILTKKHQDNIELEKKRFGWRKMTDIARGLWALYKESEYEEDEDYE